MSSPRSGSIVPIFGFLILAACGSNSTTSDGGPNPGDAGHDGGGDGGPVGDGGSAPGAPVLSFTTSAAGVQLTWTLPGAFGDEKFTVLRSDQGSGFAMVTGATAVAGDVYSDTIASALPGAGHGYEVTATNGNGTGPASNIVHVLQAPGDLVAGGSDSRVIVLWSAIGNASSYDVYRVGADGGGTAQLLANSTQAEYLDDGSVQPIATGNTYGYQVIAKNLDGGQPSTGSNVARAKALGIDVVANVVHVGDTDGGVAVPSNSHYSPFVLSSPSDGGPFEVYQTFSISNASVISGVPPGISYFTTDFYFVYDTTARTIDMSFATAGRPDVAQPNNLTSQTTMNYNLTNLSPWAAPADGGQADTIQSMSWGAGNFVNGLETGLIDAGVVAGQLTLVGKESINGTFNDLGLVDNTKGDIYYLNQLHDQHSGNSEPYQTVTRNHTSSSIHMADGSVTPITGALTAVVPTPIPSLIVKNTAFAAQKNGVNPASTNAGQTLLVGNEKDFTSYGYYGQPATLFTTSLDGTATGDVDYGLAGYGNPFPANWEPFVYVTYGFNMSFDLPGGSGGPATFEAVSAYIEPVAGFDWTNIAPPLAPMTNVKIGSASVFSDQTNVGTKPTFTWTPAAGPTPNTYLVSIYELSLDSSNAVAVGNPFFQYLQDWTFATSDTSFTVPASVLTAESATTSHWYFATIDAQYTKLGNNLVDQTATPFKDGSTYYDVEIVTNKFTPGPGTAPPSAYGSFVVSAGAQTRPSSTFRKSPMPQQPAPIGSAPNPSVKGLTVVH